MSTSLIHVFIQILEAKKSTLAHFKTNCLWLGFYGTFNWQKLRNKDVQNFSDAQLLCNTDSVLIDIYTYVYAKQGKAVNPFSWSSVL